MIMSDFSPAVLLFSIDIQYDHFDSFSLETLIDIEFHSKNQNTENIGPTIFWPTRSRPVKSTNFATSYIQKPLTFHKESEGLQTSNEKKMFDSVHSCWLMSIYVHKSQLMSTELQKGTIFATILSAHIRQCQKMSTKVCRCLLTSLLFFEALS